LLARHRSGLYISYGLIVFCAVPLRASCALKYILWITAAMLAPALPITDRTFELRVKRFSEAQQSRHQWISLADIADWCGNLTGEKDAAKERRRRLRDEAFQDLLDDAQADKFLRLLLLSADEKAPAFLDGAFLRARVQIYPEAPEVVIKAYIAKCWVSLRDARAWFISRAVSAPQWLIGSGIIDRRNGAPYGKKPKGRPRGTGFDDSAAVEYMRALITREGIPSIRSAAEKAQRIFGNGGYGTKQSAIDRYRKRYASKYGS
jgi:hypothetical protein